MASSSSSTCYHSATLSSHKASTKLAACACLLLAAMVMLAVQPAAAAPSCSGLGNEPSASEGTCDNGVVVDWCNRPACGKGPGESCGGRWNENGMCGRGMFCGCGVCHGCNRRLQCYLNAKC